MSESYIAYQFSAEPPLVHERPTLKYIQSDMFHLWSAHQMQLLHHSRASLQAFDTPMEVQTIQVPMLPEYFEPEYLYQWALFLSD